MTAPNAPANAPPARTEGMPEEAERFWVRDASNLMVVRASDYDALRARCVELQAGDEEFRRSCAQLIDADPDTWPDHGNWRLAIAATIALERQAFQSAEKMRLAAESRCEELAGELAHVKEVEFPKRIDLVCATWRHRAETAEHSLADAREQLAALSRWVPVGESAEGIVRDAGRYRWLRKYKGFNLAPAEPFIARQSNGTFSRWTDESADAAIDAARELPPPGK